jgi:ferredoxin-NADP reductase/uncharacterized protein YcbX
MRQQYYARANYAISKMIRQIATLKSITRYPVKGWPGQDMPRASLQIGCGIEYDRFFGISNGSSNIGATGWTPCQAFVRMTKNLQLPLFRANVDSEQHILELSAHGKKITVNYENTESLKNANPFLASLFPEHEAQKLKLYRREQDLGWWDHEDAEISILNMASIASLERHAEQNVNAERFRGNFLLENLRPWEELSWIGKTIRIGDAHLQILRPIDRCKATSLNPSTALADLNMPALLAKHTGHIFCGVYAKVIKAGVVSPGKPIQVLNEQGVMPIRAIPITAPPIAQWPRSTQVIKSVREDTHVISFWLKDSLLESMPTVLPGQHLRIHLYTPEHGNSWRSYTISGARDGALRISVKRNRDDGFAAHLHRSLAQGSYLNISGPHGSFVLPSTEKHAAKKFIFISAGIGITPIVAMLSTLATQADNEQTAYLVHSARNEKELALWTEAQAAAHQVNGGHSGGTCLLHMSQPNSDIAPKYLDWNHISYWPWKTASVFVCGPQAFMNDAIQTALLFGAPPERIHSERFFSPQPNKLIQPLNVSPHPRRIRINNTQAIATEFIWKPQDGSILDAAESHGINMKSNCRAGACGACALRLMAGSVQYLQEPLQPLSPDEILSCCAIPASDISLEVPR